MKRAFTLIETIIAIAILLIVMVGILGVLQMNIRVAGRTAVRVGAVSLVNERMEMLRNLAYDDIGTVNGIPSGLIPQEETVVLNNIEYTLKTFIQYFDDPTDGIGANDENGITADYKKVRVEVSWSGKYAAAPVKAVSDFMPKGIETVTGGGTLSINIFDAQIQPVSLASIRILNNEVEPNIDINVQTNDQGKIIFPGSPSVGHYQIIVTKTGYSTAKTYDASLENPSPDPGHLTILEGQTTEASFAIDKLSSLVINTMKPETGDVWSDSFIDQTKIAESFNMSIGDGMAKLLGQEGSIQWFDSNWSCRKKITINSTMVSESDSGEFNFPIMISITSDSDLVSDPQPDGDDILFTDADGTTKLDHEIELYNATDGDLIAWVKVPKISSTSDTTLYMYYGNSEAADQSNSTGVWNNNFKGAWHMKDNTISTILDSTSNNNDGEKKGSNEPIETSNGKIGNTQDFDGNDDYIQTSSNELKTENNFTLSAWFKTNSTTYAHHILWQGELLGCCPPGGNGWGPQEEMNLAIGEYTVQALPKRLSFFLGNIGDPGVNPNVLSLGVDFTDTTNWNYVAVTVSNLNTTPSAELFLNGNSVDTDTGTIAATTRPLWDTALRFGRPGKAERYWDGTLDEIRISKTVRSAYWISNEYNNQSSPSTFYNLEEEEEYEAKYYSSPGYLISDTIAPNPQELVNWDKFSWADEEPENTDIKYQIFYWDESDWVLIPEQDLADNTEGFDNSPVDLSGLDPNTYPSLRIKGNFSTTNFLVTPILFDWQVHWNNNIKTSLGNVSFEMIGAKIIGEDSGAQPVYKYSKTHTSDINGRVSINNLEWDIYDISSPRISPTQYDISASSPPEPINIEPDTSNILTLYLVPHASNTLLVTVKNTAEELITNASVRLFRSGYNETILTGETSQSFFTPLTVGTDYSLEVGKDGYESQLLEDVLISGQSEITIIMAAP